MKENLLSAIKAHDFTAIRNICFALSKQERTDLIHTLQTARWEQLYHNTQKKAPRLALEERNYFSYSLLCLCRTSEELKEIKLSGETISSNDQMILYMSRIHFSEILNLIETQEGKYLITLFKSFSEEDLLTEFAFQNLWTLYQKGFIAFDEDLFIEKFFFWNNKHITDEPFVDFLLENKQISEKIFAIVPQHITQEVPYPSDAWKELYSILQAKGYFADRSIVSSHIEALLNPYKKNVLDFYCRIIETFEPTRQELLSHQSTFFALLSSDKTSVVNFVMKLIKEIANEKDFDFQTFADNFALCFATQKIAKSQLIGLDILAKHYKQQPPINLEYREQLAVLFTVPDAKLQEKVANLLTTYFNQEGLPEVIAPYCDYLKGKAQDLLATLSPSENSENSENSKNSHTSHSSHTPLSLGEGSGERILFLLGDCIREGTAATIDLFFEGLVQLQDQLPENFKEQLAPYIKQLGGYSVSGRQVRAMLLLLRGWAEDKAIETPPKEWEPYIKKVRELEKSKDKKDQQEGAWLWCVYSTHKELLYFFNKIKTTISKLKNGDRLPFLATPSVKPFYIDADTLANRLLIYQTAGKEPELDDIVVAANRLLSSTITPEAKDKVRTLTGKYARAMAYLFELTDEITPEEEILPLWTQMTRIKHPNAIFEEFKNTSAYDYPAVVKPFYIHSYTIDDYRFHLENDYNYYGFKKEKALPYNFYNAGNYDKLHSSTFKYFMSLNPQYLDALLCRYVPYWVRISDATTYEDLNQITTFLLVNDLRIYHSGWLFMGIAFLHDKKETRDLATEYILRAISRDEDLSYLQHFLADILAQKLTPINRFVEFLDMPTRNKKVKEFQKGVVEEYLRLVENVEKKPTNHKKLVAFIN